MALTSPSMPSAPGKTSYSLNAATWRGETAIGAALSHRLDIGAPLSVNVGFSYAGEGNKGGRIGIAGEF
jgi:hypothetical protein